MVIELVLPLGFILAGLLGGIISEKFIFNKLKQFVANRKIPGSTILFRSLNRMIFIWCLLAGLYGAIISSHAEPEVTDLLKRIFTIIFLYSVTLVVARLVAGFVNLYLQRSEGLSASLLSNLAKIIVLILGTLILLQTIGVQITPIITTLGISGLAVGLALQDTLTNLFAGFYLIFSKQVRTGDYLKIEGGHEGYVIDINWRHTTVKELSNNVIVIPNSKLGTAIFTNYHLPGKEIILMISVGVGYDSDLEQVEQVTVEVAKEVMKEIAPELLENQPYIRFETFGDSSINFTLYMAINEFFDQRIARHLFIKKLHKRYQKEGIKIPFPIRDVYLQNNGNSNRALKAE
ncbi:mechanosensitive ion channel family protein [Aetokthonos hydrillicola Thurmond2011]|jgi:small-conductance mechanosensitive channel|uniref:Mechanosensitive ion channel family protein n=1 Tax=Aetokthonos hydrillicola Thurmond2011 TaxID=2712845 RepID=A0AAP5IDI5_9CYAN|nr:mechanosensitive ion channel family protein [Aetokthonos hydrillicola]MBO3459720.1 mechanosensitive ion channel family protein [Aetokthonos hydrillicola CCALA 1050]MBW4585152.1 mechanosensitive ion channel family protein [Aetokthonos hydrillicola CCALA 1050]MDR9899491.1 mechanosensitive ion channel family protein [Aetokthonos hydrillicola Thurmond2011]